MTYNKIKKVIDRFDLTKEYIYYEGFKLFTTEKLRKDLNIIKEIFKYETLNSNDLVVLKKLELLYKTKPMIPRNVKHLFTLISYFLKRNSNND